MNVLVGLAAFVVVVGIGYIIPGGAFSRGFGSTVHSGTLRHGDGTLLLLATERGAFRWQGDVIAHNVYAGDKLKGGAG